MPDILRFFFDLLAVPTDGFDPLALLFRRLEVFIHIGKGVWIGTAGGTTVETQ